ncbi:hypothetical protein B6U80_01050 [Candidatus Pacearchaeota archaeon ex4484_26]|nr:MAG: hypothetical protein B6U80_01050 [Candidatus Pacearchaeota archaeon ex4484_26]
MSTPLWTILVVVLATIIGAFGAIYLKKASSFFLFNLKFILNKNFLFGMSFYIISTIIYLFALKFGELSILFPTISTSYIWISILSQKMLREKMNFLKWAGIIGIIIGTIFLGLKA